MIASSNQYVAFLSPTYSGRVHDAQVAHLENCQFPESIRVYKDLGYLGYQPDGPTLMAPIKKTRKAALSALQKWYNTTNAKVRVYVEHAIAGIKRCRIIKDRCRINYPLRDQCLLLATGLHNLRVFLIEENITSKSILNTLNNILA